MPVVPSTFRPPPLLGNGHAQTILSAMLPRRWTDRWEPERLELSDGDFLDLAWRRAGHPRLVILSHGLEGSASQSYIRGMAETLAAAGWDALAWNFRGCGPQPNRLLRAYHSGDTPDLAAVIERAARDHGHIALIGFSLGGNLTLKYLGERTPPPAVKAAVAISAPVDLAASARRLDRHWANRIYLRRFIRALVTKIEAKVATFPGQLDADGLRRIRSFQEFDHRFTAPLHGFASAEDYWAKSSALPWLGEIRLPTLLLNARNDPFLTPSCFPVHEAEENPHFILEAPASGGHVAFLDFRHGLQPWSERRVAAFLSEHARA